MQTEEYYQIQESLSGRKTPAYDKVIRTLQREVVKSEKEQLDQGFDQYSEKEVSQAVVHTRQDMILVVGYLNCIILQNRSFEIALWTIVLLLGVLVVKSFF